MLYLLVRIFKLYNQYGEYLTIKSINMNFTITFKDDAFDMKDILNEVPSKLEFTESQYALFLRPYYINNIKRYTLVYSKS